MNETTHGASTDFVAASTSAHTNPEAPFVVDAHAHYFPRMLSHSHVVGDPRWPTLSVRDADTGFIMLGDKVFRGVRSPLWDTNARMAELDAHNIDAQVVSPVPILLTYWADRGPAVSFAQTLNESLAADIAHADGRLYGLGTVPLQDADAAVRELERVMGDLRLSGVEIGTRVGDKELDDPDLLPFFEAAESLGAAIFIHPMDGGGGAIRRSGQPYDFGLGMLTDTAMAATALVFGGVLEKFPNLRIGLAHGCGTFAWAYPRLELGAQITEQTSTIMFDDLVRRLWVDSLVFDRAHLGVLAHRFGDNQIMLGTDYPFIPGQLEGARELTASEASDGRRLLGRNALNFIGIPTPPTVEGHRPLRGER